MSVFRSGCLWPDDLAAAGWLAAAGAAALAFLLLDLQHSQAATDCEPNSNCSCLADTSPAPPLQHTSDYTLLAAFCVC